MLTPKENLMKCINGEVPEYVPTFTWGRMPGDKEAPPSAKLGPSILFQHREGERGVDLWGVPHVANNGASIPEPGKHILTDITKWRDVIKKPDLSGVDWEMMAKKDLEKAGINPEETAIVYHMHVGYFQNLMAFMGFEGGMCAMYEEPEEVLALFDMLSDFYCEIAEKSFDYYRPEFMGLTDDTATELNPFISIDMFEELLMPAYRKQCEVSIKRGLPVEIHNCGRCEDQIPFWEELNIRAWDPAQTMNDLKGIKEKYGNKIVLVGCWEGRDYLDPNISEEEFKQSIIDTIDTFAPGGGFCWSGGMFAMPGDELNMKKNRWIYEVVSTYGKDFYKTH